jgi:hypothetical protein
VIVLRINRQQTLELFFIFSLFLLSTVSSFLHFIWLIPPLVLFESALWLILAVILIRRLKENGKIPVFIAGLKRNWIIFPFLIYSGLSIAWSISREITLYRWLILVFTITGSAYLGLRYNPKEILKFLAGFGVLILFVSTIVVIILPSVG